MSDGALSRLNKKFLWNQLQVREVLSVTAINNSHDAVGRD
jgi:hypothetical protein